MVKVKILIVDWCEDRRKVWESIYSDVYYETTLVETWDAVEGVLDENSYDVVFLDDLSGRAKALKRLGEQTPPPVVVINKSLQRRRETEAERAYPGWIHTRIPGSEDDYYAGVVIMQEL